VELSRARRKVWIHRDQILWCEPAGSGAKLHFLDGQDLTVDQSPDEVDILFRKKRE
jgi:hypothetical protein